MATVNSIEIQVKTEADNSRKSLEALRDTLRGLRGECQNGAGLKEVASALERIKKAAGEAKLSLGLTNSFVSATATDTKGLNAATDENVDSIKELTKALKDCVSAFGNTKDSFKEVKEEGEKLNENIKTTNKSFDKFMKSAAHVAFYRAIRTALKEITDAFKEGTQNVYAYSAANDGVFKSIMDNFSSVKLSLRNQIGSWASEMLALIMPTIVKILETGKEIVDVFSQIFAVLNGKTTYLKAADGLATSWNEATGAVKEYKSQLLGIDELNIINEDNGAKGGGASSINPADMFEETGITLSDTFVETLEKIRNTLPEILTAAKMAGIAFAAWKIPPAFVGFFKSLFENKLSGGLTFAITGLAFEWVGAYDWGVNGATFGNVLETILGAGAAIGVGLLAFGAGSLFFTIPLVIGVGAVAFKKGRDMKIRNEMANTRIGSTILQLDSDFKQIVEENVELQARISNITPLIDSDTLYNLEYAKKLTNKIFELDIKENKAAYEVDVLMTKIDALNALGLEGVQLEFDTTTQHVVGSRDAILETIAALKEKYKYQALEEAYAEAYKAEFDAALQLQQALEKVNALREEREGYELIKQEFEECTKALADFIDQNDLFYDGNGEIQIGNEKTAESYNKLKAKVDDAREAYEEIRGAYRLSGKMLKENEEALESIQATYDSTKDKILELDNYAKSLTDSFKEQKASISEATQALYDFKSINSQVGMLAVPSRTITTKANGGIVEQYASGGVPTHGQLFIANEGMAPEMIGMWGSQTAVANADQIVNGIQQGVASAVSGVLAPYLAQIANNTRETANKDVSIRIGDRDIAQANRRGERLLGASLIS